ncbi:MAG: Globin-coupled histidine kinase [Deltaproteobacteria bacterium ADurb.BinA179]|nr:PEP-CTERM system histidine kinase PrsK [Deltaproteobacteria bacterium]MDI9542957.1 PEP-CTERM system histidine kinase PrsK [Pseudomonadota bacterium]OPZ27947.1 MAG: Globin-coupled histidine kinase [Deltaproteobacteria bacterium ADurb.BinA179]HRR20644.1 PEP-CTERM system histidine kinase PrsK [Desulfomonilia bacterium]HOD69550.1 PEP-CTERM system histidine kinase PrsK [Deltaproteobacteria bacterium]
MELTIFSITALISFVGGMVILSRSGARYGRSMAVGLLFLSAAEIFYILTLHQDSIAFLRFASFFEMASAGAFLLSVTSMESGLSRSKPLILWERRLLVAACITYGALALSFPLQTFTRDLEGLIRIGWIGKAQAIFIITSAVAFMWIMENIHRSSTDDQKRILKYPMLGVIALGVAFLLMGVYRLSIPSIHADMIMLHSLIFLVGITFVIFFSIRFKLFEMDIFVSRYIVYHSITFLSIGAYLVAMGLFLLGVQRLGIRISFVGLGFFVFMTLFILAFILVSKGARDRLRFFINTHFFANKYDYRKEWGELSGYLSIAFNEKQIIHVTAQVILDSMYITELSIMLKDGSGFRCGYAFPTQFPNRHISADEPLIAYLERHHYFLRKTPPGTGDELWEKIVTEHQDFLDLYRIELAVAMMVENRLIGYIAVGRENPGTPYGRDDIDLLTAIASQSSAALMSARFAQELAVNKEVDAFNRMSSYVLHDLKNAAGNLSLILQNAPNHMDSEEFRADMIETISQTLGRIDKVMSRLGAMPSREELSRESVPVEDIVTPLLSKLDPRFGKSIVTVSLEPGLCVRTNRDMLERILENLIINATEAVPEKGSITIRSGRDGGAAYISIQDNGAGMTEEFVRERLFKPFQTTKKHGTGLGLWQVKSIADQLGIAVDVENRPAQGVKFTLRIPD